MLHESKLSHASSKLKLQAHSESDVYENSTDSALEYCENLIKQEYDLIHSMKIIAEFDYNISPMQVRSCENHLDIIKDILEKKENAYRNCDKLIELGRLMNVDKENMNVFNDMVPQLRQLIAEHALKKKNLSIAKKMCSDLIDINYGQAWPCVYNLAFSFASSIIDAYQIDNINDNVFLSIANHEFDFKIQQKNKLMENLDRIEKCLSFVLVYCDSDCIQEVIFQRLNIEKARTQVELNEINLHFNTEEEMIQLDNLQKFYLNSNKSINDETMFFEKDQTIKSLLENLIHLRSQHMDSGCRLVFTKIVNQLAKSDASVLFSYLLELDEDMLILFEDLESFRFDSILSYEFLLYLFGLNIVSHENCQKIHLFKPSILNEYIMGLELNEETTSSRAYKKIDKLYSEFNHKNQLQNLNQNINLKRFESDQIYRNETILGLSDSLSTFKLACSLAKFYSLDLWEVYMSFTKNLFLDCELNLSLDDLKTHVKPLLSVLNRKAESFISIMNEEILSKIDGRDLDKLITFYTILNDQNSQTHIKLLGKIKSVDFTTGFDYKVFMEKPLEAIEPFLNDTNVPYFTKLVSKLPSKSSSSGHTLSESKINVIWCLKKFWSHVEAIKENQSSSPVDILDTIGENVRKIDADSDLTYFVNELTMSRRSASKLTLPMRRELVKRLGRMFKQPSKDKFNKNLQKIQAHLRLVESLEKCVNHNERHYVEQIDIETSSVSQDRYNNETESSSGSETRIRKLEEILIRMLFDSCSLEKLHQIIRVLDVEHNISVKKLIKIALNKISTILKQDDCTNKLNSLLDAISNYLHSTNSIEKSTEIILNEEDVLECMRTFCNDQQIDINTRLFILEKLKKIIKTMTDNDLMLLLLYKTNAVLANCNFFDGKLQKIEAASINLERKRSELILEWISYAKSAEEYSAILNLIRIWPKFTQSSPIFAYLKKLAIDQVEIVNILKSVFEQDDANLILSIEDLKTLKTSLKEETTKWNNKDEVLKRNFIKLCIIFKSKENLEFVVSYLQSADLECLKLMETEEIDDLESCESYLNLLNDYEIVHLILKDDFYCKLLNTKFYSVLLKSIIINKTKPELLRIARVLKGNNFNIEAGYLLTLTNNFLPSHKNLSISLALINKFY